MKIWINFVPGTRAFLCYSDVIWAAAGMTRTYISRGLPLWRFSDAAAGVLLDRRALVTFYPPDYSAPLCPTCGDVWK